MRLGGTVANLTAWAWWRSQKQARHYGKHPPKWEFSDSIVLPLPKRFTRFPSEDVELTTIKTNISGLQTPGRDRLRPLTHVLDMFRRQVGQRSPVRNPQRWTAIPPAPQSRTSPAWTARQTKKQSWARDRMPENGQQPAAGAQHTETGGGNGTDGEEHNPHKTGVVQPPEHPTTTDEDMGGDPGPGSPERADTPPPPTSTPPPPVPGTGMPGREEDEVDMVAGTPPPRSQEGHRGRGRRSSPGQKSEGMSHQERPYTPKTKYFWYQSRCHAEQGPVKQHHTLGMTSVRLSTKGNLPTRRPGRQVLCHCHRMWEKFQGHVEKVQRAIRRVVRSPGFSSHAQKTTVELLREWVLLTLNRAWEGGAFPLR